MPSGLYVVFFPGAVVTPTGIDDDEAIPAEFELKANYPNPFNPTTTIEYTLGSSSVVQLDIYNISGQKVRTLANATQAAGTYSAVWDGTDNNGNAVSSGAYIYSINAEGFQQSRKMMLIK